jgi:hypothetical protein
MKIKSNPYPVISRTYFQFNETIYSLPQSREIIPLNGLQYLSVLIIRNT